MRLFDDDHVPTTLDSLRHRVETTQDGDELKVVDLTLRVQPLTPALAVSFDPDLRALVFSMLDASPKPKVESLKWRYAVPAQRVVVQTTAELPAGLTAYDVAVSEFKLRTEKGVPGFALTFSATFGPVGADELEYLQAWLGEDRVVTWGPQQPSLFDGAGQTETSEPLTAA